ncbi:MAG: 4,5-dihydroxyphthalate dehydrogenase [Chloroflexi bacterium]|nr:4,5-dihydroxyphthalate dehydrogenase [Chloroflexota bacterium]
MMVPKRHTCVNATRSPLLYDGAAAIRAPTAPDHVGSTTGGLMAAERVLRFGIAGVGVGASNLLGGFKRNPRVKVTAAADLRTDAVEAFGREFGCETYGSVEAMCKSPNVDAVWVSTPNQFHAEHAILAAEHGKHVTVSKPMAITLEECEAMNQAAERNGVKLLSGHTQAMLAPIRKMAELVHSGDYGRLGMVHSWNYTDWMYRPRMPYELDVSKGGGVVFRQSPHHIDIVRLIGGGLVRSVRAMTLELDTKRPAPGAFVAYLQFEDGTPATIVYSGYGHFGSHEITFESSYRPPMMPRDATPEQEAALKEARRYTGSGPSETRPEEEPPWHSAFGLTLVTCERADIRQSPHGLWVYDDAGKREIEVPKAESRGEPEFDEMYQAVVRDRPVVHSGRWGQATHEVSLAIMESARTGREIMMSHQVSLPEGAV